MEAAPNPLVALAEKAIWTFLQAFAGFLLTAQILDASTANAATLAAVAATGTVVANGVPGVPVGLPFGVDVALRAVRTFAVSFLTLFFGAPVFELSTSAANAALIAAIPAALAVVKAGAASRIGDPSTASTLRVG